MMLAVAPRRPEAPIPCRREMSRRSSARFRAETQMLHDETTGRDEKPVQIGRKNIKLLLDTEAAGDLVTLPIARIMRDGSGHFIFDEVSFRRASRSAPASG